MIINEFSGYGLRIATDNNAVYVTIPATASKGKRIFTTVMVTSQPTLGVIEEVSLISVRYWPTYLPLVQKS
ncbi:MAG: hypothetical protein R3A44_21380 [Caldilineaceae bacterium]